MTKLRDDQYAVSVSLTDEQRTSCSNVLKRLDIPCVVLALDIGKYNTTFIAQSNEECNLICEVWIAISNGETEDSTFELINEGN